MINNTFLIIQSQFSDKKNELIKLKQFVITDSSANDEICFYISKRRNFYSIKDIMKILNISTSKEVESLIKKLDLNQTTYCRIKNNELFYNMDAINRLSSYLKFRVA